MSDDLGKDVLPLPGEAIDPVAMARRDLKKALPRRFYTRAEAVEQGAAFVLHLDGRPAKTPAKQLLALPTQAAAEAIAAEWREISDTIDPAAMPLTRLANSALDGVALQSAEVTDEILRYAGSDLLCYRADAPEALVKAQAAAWDPLLAFVEEKLGARFICAEGVMFVAQPEPALIAVRDAVGRIAARGPSMFFALAALNVMTTLTGSALIALAVGLREISAEAAWRAAHVDEDFQMHIWGADEEALRRRARRWSEMEAAARLLDLVS